MIIRDPVLSERRRVVGRQIADADVLGARSDREARVVGAVRNQPAEIDAAPADDPGQQEPAARENRLSFETVAAWLVVQDEQTRAACASLLADDLTQVHESAKADGFAVGNEQGRAEAQGASERIHTALQAVASSAETAFSDEQLRLTELCVDVVAEALTKIAGPLLATREAAIGAVAEVLKRVKEGRELTIRVCPADLQPLQEEEGRLAIALGRRKFALVADARIDVGGCVVESKLGNLDGRLEVQLRELYQTLRAAKSSQPEMP